MNSVLYQFIPVDDIVSIIEDYYLLISYAEIIQDFGFEAVIFSMITLNNMDFFRLYYQDMLFLLDETNWINISKYREITSDFCEMFLDQIYWSELSLVIKINRLDFIRKFQDQLNWKIISSYHVLSEEFMAEFSHKLDWVQISFFQSLSLKSIKRFRNYLNLAMIIRYQGFSSAVINEL